MARIKVKLAAVVCFGLSGGELTSAYAYLSSAIKNDAPAPPIRIPIKNAARRRIRFPFSRRFSAYGSELTLPPDVSPAIIRPASSAMSFSSRCSCSGRLFIIKYAVSNGDEFPPRTIIIFL